VTGKSGWSREEVEGAAPAAAPVLARTPSSGNGPAFAAEAASIHAQSAAAAEPNAAEEDHTPRQEPDHAPAASDGDGAVDDDVEEKFDEAHKRNYYYNKVTGATGWTRGEVSAAPSLEEGGAAAAAAAASEAAAATGGVVDDDVVDDEVAGSGPAAEAEAGAAAAAPPPPAEGSAPPAAAPGESVGEKSKRMSTLSLQAISELGKHQARFDELEQKVHVIQDKMEASAFTTRLELNQKISELAQVNGNLEKLQFVGIDGVTTQDLSSGKDEARSTRKKLNTACEALKDQIGDMRPTLLELRNALPEEHAGPVDDPHALAVAKLKAALRVKGSLMKKGLKRHNWTKRHFQFDVDSGVLDYYEKVSEGGGTPAPTATAVAEWCTTAVGAVVRRDGPAGGRVGGVGGLVGWWVGEKAGRTLARVQRPAAPVLTPHPHPVAPHTRCTCCTLALVAPCTRPPVLARLAGGGRGEAVQAPQGLHRPHVRLHLLHAGAQERQARQLLPDLCP
jgi:hypothetical protein